MASQSIISLLHVLLLGSSVVSAADIPVAVGDDINTVLSGASGGDTLVLADGTHTLSAEISITKEITIKAANSGLAIVDGDNSVRIVTVSADVTVRLEGLEIQNGFVNSAGGCIEAAFGQLTVVNSNIHDCLAQWSNGGAISVNQGATFTMTDGDIYNCIGEYGGHGVSLNGGEAILVRVNVRNNGWNANNGISKQAHVTWGANGGGIRTNCGVLTMTDGTVRENTGLNGAGIYTDNGCEGEKRISLENVDVTGNVGVDHDADDSMGGGLYVEGFTVELSGSTKIHGNEASADANIKPASGEVVALLPVRPGHWLPNSRCVVYREACDPYDTECQNNVQSCATIGDKLTDGAEASAALGGGAVYANDGKTYVSGGSYTCPTRTLAQPCNWDTFPELLGESVYTLPIGLGVEESFPFECGVGVHGGAALADQASSECKGICPAGKFCPTKATIEPQTCPIGHYCPLGSAFPIPCPAGTVNPAPGKGLLSDCAMCEAGTVCPLGSATAAECPIGEYCLANSDRGVPCTDTLEGGTTAGNGARSIEDCACKPGLFLKDGECADGQATFQALGVSLEGIDLSQPGVSVVTLPLKENFWRVSNVSLAVGKCYTEGVCKGATPGGAKESEESTSRRHLAETLTDTYGDALCRGGHTGPFCESCVAKYYRDSTGLCVDCEASGSDVVLSLAAPIIAIVLLLVVGLGFACKGRKEAIKKMQKKADEKVATKTAEAQASGKEIELEHSSSKPSNPSNLAGVRGKILLSLVQVLTQISTVFDIRFPNVFGSVLRWFGVLQLDLLTLMPLDCFFPSNFHTTLLLRTLIPLTVMGLLATCGRLAFHKANKTTNPSWTWLGNLLMNLVFFILFLIYPSTSSNIFATFQCKALDDGTRWLRADLRIDCNSGAHVAMQGYAGVMVFVYPVGAPLLYAYLLFQVHGKTLRQVKTIEVQRIKLNEHARAEDSYTAVLKESKLYSESMVRQVAEKTQALKKEEDALVNELPSYVQALVGNGYAKRVFYFEIIECLRKLSVVCLPVFFDAGSTEQLLFALVITFCTFGAYSTLVPYSNTTDHALALLAQAVIFINLISSLAQPMGLFMDVVLTTLLVGFTAVSGLLSCCGTNFGSITGKLTPQTKTTPTATRV
jgi:hypothetical protein